MNASTRAATCVTPRTIDEDIEDLKKLTLDDVRQFYEQFYGAGEGEIVDLAASSTRRR